MPVLMDKTDWTETLENAKRSSRVWHQHVMGRVGENLLSLPESGSMIGFGKRFHAPRPTEEWMKELREGEE